MSDRYKHSSLLQEITKFTKNITQALVKKFIYLLLYHYRLLGSYSLNLLRSSHNLLNRMYKVSSVSKTFTLSFEKFIHSLPWPAAMAEWLKHSSNDCEIKGSNQAVKRHKEKMAEISVRKMIIL